jgi:hypothetical protein
MRFTLTLLLPLIAIGLLAELAHAATLAVSQAPADGAFPLVADGRPANIQVDADDADVVHLAADLFAADVERVTDHKPTVITYAGVNTKTAVGPMVIVGTIGKSRAIDGLVSAGKLDITPIKNKWEGYLLATVADTSPGVKQALVIAGSDRRGTAFGVFTLSEAIGVSPWYWWADVPPKKKPQLYVSLPAAVSDSPGVKYRGIFMNDEDWGLNPWAKETFDPQFKNIGPKTYEKVFELLLRLRLNYIWPAMHAVSAEFGSAPENVALADKYGIVAGSSHCEPMLCNNVHWNEKDQGNWNYSTNRDTIHAYWETNAKARGSEEAVWTLGIRGIHDKPMETPPTRMPDKISLVSQVIQDQRDLLHQYVTTQFGPVAQCFVPYKEVLPIYDAGLKVPDDVTLVWVDDNFGYIRRLSNVDERKRSGGSGVYWHLSYYGGPHSYTWINSTPPALIWEELHKAWDNQARTLWVINVGDIKPGEIGIDYYAHLAWNPEGVGPDSQPQALRDFAAKNFGDELAQPIADLLTEFYRLGAIHKPELMNREWAMLLPADRAAQLGRDYDGLLKREQALAATIPPEARDAYTETIGFPARVLASTGLIFMADRNIQLGIDPAANQSQIAQLRGELESQVKNFNTEIAGGKWNHVMPGLVTGKDLTAWSSQVRWPWGEKLAQPGQAAASTRPTDQPPTGQPWRNAATANRNTSQGTAHWGAIVGLGPSSNAMALLPASLESSWKEGDASAPVLEYDFASQSGDVDAFVDFVPTFRIYPGMKLRVAIAVDDRAATAVEVPGSSGAENEGGPIRKNAVQDNYVRLRVPLPGLSAGKHVFKIRAIDPGAVIDQISLPESKP